MNFDLLKPVFHILLVSLTSCLSSIAQSNSVITDNNYDCANRPLGLFRQVTGASWRQADMVDETIVVNKESDTKENRWTLVEIDEVDPAYKFYLTRRSTISDKAKCGPRIDVAGKMISPTGKVFDLVQATYDIPERKLKFCTVDREGVGYKGEIQFLPPAVFANRRFRAGTVKLKASGKTLGIVSLEFPITSWNSE